MKQMRSISWLQAPLETESLALSGSQMFIPSSTHLRVERRVERWLPPSPMALLSL